MDFEDSSQYCEIESQKHFSFFFPHSGFHILFPLLFLFVCLVMSPSPQCCSQRCERSPARGGPNG